MKPRSKVAQKAAGKDKPSGKANGSSKATENGSLLRQSISETCTRLEKLHKELNAIKTGAFGPEAEVDADDDDIFSDTQTDGTNKTVTVSTIEQTGKDLVSLLKTSTDKQIQVLTCCCLSDTLRISAPKSPFGNNELKLIFKHFIAQLSHVSNASDPLFHLYFYLLETISTVKSVVLLAHLSMDALVILIFTDFFKIIR